MKTKIPFITGVFILILTLHVITHLLWNYAPLLQQAIGQQLLLQNLHPLTPFQNLLFQYCQVLLNLKHFTVLLLWQSGSCSLMFLSSTFWEEVYDPLQPQ